MLSVGGRDIRSYRRYSDCWSALEETTPARPALLLSVFSRFYEGIWRKADKPWLKLPRDLVNILFGSHPQKDLIRHETISFDANALLVLGAWRMSKGVYVFDHDFAPALDSSSLSDLPASLFQHLPERAVYIPMEVPDLHMHGFFASLMGPGNGHIMLLTDSKHPAAWPIPCINKMKLDTIEEYLRIMVRELDGEPDYADAFEAQIKHIRTMLLRLLYLSADKPDIKGSPVLARTVKTKRGPKLILPEAVNRWDVGLRLGAIFRRYSDELVSRDGEDAADAETISIRPRPRPHLRRAHWHTYLTGEGRTIPRVRWIHPVMVNANESDDLVTTMRPVETD